MPLQMSAGPFSLVIFKAPFDDHLFPADSPDISVQSQLLPPLLSYSMLDISLLSYLFKICFPYPVMNSSRAEFLFTSVSQARNTKDTNDEKPVPASGSELHTESSAMEDCPAAGIASHTLCAGVMRTHTPQRQLFLLQAGAQETKIAETVPRPYGIWV